MPVPQHVVRMLLAGIVAAIASTSCSSDGAPTVSEAGTRLAADAKTVVHKVQDSHDMAQPFHVTEDATRNVPCGTNKAKRMFAAQGAIPSGPDLDRALDNEVQAALGIAPDAFKISSRPAGDGTAERKLVLADDDNHLQLAVTLTPRGSTIGYGVTGETGCLRDS